MASRSDTNEFCASNSFSSVTSLRNTKPECRRMDHLSPRDLRSEDYSSLDRASEFQICWQAAMARMPPRPPNTGTQDEGGPYSGRRARVEHHQKDDHSILAAFIRCAHLRRSQYAGALLERSWMRSKSPRFRSMLTMTAGLGENAR
jgi:hypothetical protein